MSEFEKAFIRAGMKFIKDSGISDDTPLGFTAGSKWARNWVLKNDPVVLNMYKALNDFDSISEDPDFTIGVIKDYKAAIK